MVNSNAGAAELCGFLDSKKIRWMQHGVRLFSFLLVIYNYHVSADKYLIRGSLSLWLFRLKFWLGCEFTFCALHFHVQYPISIFLDKCLWAYFTFTWVHAVQFDILNNCWNSIWPRWLMNLTNCLQFVLPVIFKGQFC